MRSPSGTEARSFVVEFGPSRSTRFATAVAEAKTGATSLDEAGAGRCRATFVLGRDAGVYAALARLIQRVWHWRASEVYEGGELVSCYHAKEMAWCASTQLQLYARCQFRFFNGLLFPRCAYCPLFDAERAVRDMLGENPAPTTYFEIELGPNFRAMLRGEMPPGNEPPERPEVPDFVPDEWADPPADDPFA